MLNDFSQRLSIKESPKGRSRSLITKYRICYNGLMICKCQPDDAKRIYFIINEAAKAYEGVIPADCYHQPYMPMDELEREMKRMTFFGWEANGELVGIMGFEPIKDVTLNRHAYVLPQ